MRVKYGKWPWILRKQQWKELSWELGCVFLPYYRFLDQGPHPCPSKKVSMTQCCLTICETSWWPCRARRSSDVEHRHLLHQVTFTLVVQAVGFPEADEIRPEKKSYILWIRDMSHVKSNKLIYVYIYIQIYLYEKFTFLIPWSLVLGIKTIYFTTDKSHIYIW